MTWLRRLLRDERGEIEDIPAYTILIVGIILPLIAVIIAVGRYGLSENTVQAAASAAARDATLSASSETAAPNAQAAAIRVLGGQRCASLNVDVYGDGLHTGLGQTGTVSARITCTINNSDLFFPMVPGQWTITETATSPVDPYRERS